MTRREKEVKLSAVTLDAIRLFRVARYGEQQARKADRIACKIAREVPGEDMPEFVRRTVEMTRYYTE